MSWSVGFIGKTSNVVAALEAESAKLDTTSRLEYDAAKPFLIGLVKQNFEAAEVRRVAVQDAGCPAGLLQ